MLARTLAVALLAALSGVQAQQPGAPPAPSTAVPARSPRNANYRIAATLDPHTRTIAGNETITWRNITNAPATTLQFHLYYNAWRDARSTWMRERILAGTAAALLELPPGDWASIDVSRLVVAREGAATDLTARMRFIAPDDGNADDRTVMEVPLDSPVTPGQTAPTLTYYGVCPEGHWIREIGAVETEARCGTCVRTYRVEDEEHA